MCFVSACKTMCEFWNHLRPIKQQLVIYPHEIYRFRFTLISMAGND
jgi:hypothetical protein